MRISRGINRKGKIEDKMERREFFWVIEGKVDEVFCYVLYGIWMFNYNCIVEENIFWIEIFGDFRYFFFLRRDLLRFVRVYYKKIIVYVVFLV